MVSKAAVRMRRWRARHPEAKVRNATLTSQRREMLRLEAVAAYGGVCVCCKEDNPAFLTFDHISGGGSRRRGDRTEPAGRNFYLKLNRLGYPRGEIQIMCFNCNCARSLRGNGICPHAQVG